MSRHPYLDIRHRGRTARNLKRKMAKEKEITVIMSLHEIDLAQKISDKVVCVKRRQDCRLWEIRKKYLRKEKIIREQLGLIMVIMIHALEV